MGPLSSKLENVKELGPHPDNIDPLEQSTSYYDRIFLKDKKERMLMIKLITETISPEEFLESEVESENGRILQRLVKNVYGHHRCVPKQYLNFLADLSKVTSITGYIQITSSRVLDLLQDFINRTLDIFSANQKNNLDIIRKEVPALWKSIYEIMLLEKSRHLDDDMKEIMQKLIDMRIEIFEKAAERLSSDYTEWDGGEHETMMYPLWPIIQYPRNYHIGKKKDIQKEEVCDKKVYKKGQKWGYGVFSVGCSCSKNITYG